MVGRACGVEGVKPGMYVEPIATTVGSQDTTGPMTRDEIKELAALSLVLIWLCNHSVTQLLIQNQQILN